MFINYLEVFSIQFKDTSFNLILTINKVLNENLNERLKITETFGLFGRI